jgi:hypothetical protein
LATVVSVTVTSKFRGGPRLVEYFTGAGLAGLVAGLLVDVEGAARMLDSDGVVPLSEVYLRDERQRLPLEDTELACVGEIESGVGVLQSLLVVAEA